MRATVLLIATLAAANFALLCSRAQSPGPVIVQAISPASAAAKATPPPAATSGFDSTSVLQRLQEMQATNAATLKKQEATLEALDELQKAADEIKIFSKRG